MRAVSGRGRVFRSASAEERYDVLERGLVNLHDLTGILPTIKKLDGEIKKDGDLAVAGGTNSDIWRGRWLGQKHVSSFYPMC
jgi:hypothetical protein